MEGFRPFTGIQDVGVIDMHDMHTMPLQCRYAPPGNMNTENAYRRNVGPPQTA